MLRVTLFALSAVLAACGSSAAVDATSAPTIAPPSLDGSDPTCASFSAASADDRATFGERSLERYRDSVRPATLAIFVDEVAEACADTSLSLATVVDAVIATDQRFQAISTPRPTARPTASPPLLGTASCGDFLTASSQQQGLTITDLSDARGARRSALHAAVQERCEADPEALLSEVIPAAAAALPEPTPRPTPLPATPRPTAKPTPVPTARPTTNTGGPALVAYSEHLAVSAMFIGDGLTQVSEDASNFDIVALQGSSVDLWILLGDEVAWLADYTPHSCFADLHAAYSGAIDTLYEALDLISDGALYYDADLLTAGTALMIEGSDAINGVTEMVPAAQVACGL